MAQQATIPLSYLTGAVTPQQQDRDEERKGLFAQVQQQTQAKQTAAMQPQQPVQTFAQMQAQGQARPPAPAPAPAPAPLPAWFQQRPWEIPAPNQLSPSTPPSGPGSIPGATPPISLDSDLRNAILNMIRNPGANPGLAFDQSLASEGRKIDDDFRMRETALREDMARRGLADSSILGGRLQDLNIGRRSAETDLLDRLALERTQRTDENLYRALGLAGQLSTGDRDFELDLLRLLGLGVVDDGYDYGARV